MEAASAPGSMAARGAVVANARRDLADRQEVASAWDDQDRIYKNPDGTNKKDCGALTLEVLLSEVWPSVDVYGRFSLPDDFGSMEALVAYPGLDPRFMIYDKSVCRTPAEVVPRNESPRHGKP